MTPYLVRHAMPDVEPEVAQQAAAQAQRGLTLLEYVARKQIATSSSMMPWLPPQMTTSGKSPRPRLARSRRR